MRKIIFYSGALFLILFLQTCILFKKEIPKPVVVKLEEVPGFISITNNSGYPKYVVSFTEQDYYNAFMKGFNGEGALTKNVTIDNSSSNPDYIIKFTKVEIIESDFAETINNAKSAMNGQVVYLNKVEVSASADCINAKTNKKIGMTCSNLKVKNEKLKNNRSAADLMFGTNKDKTVYREKGLRESIAKDLAEDVGRRIWVPISKRIKNDLK
ncbi:MAG: hypothetical protein JNM96_04475 [Bacteroidia bacterium]|nr:hypothetical protein [Bacteroidia bacterium]